MMDDSLIIDKIMKKSKRIINPSTPYQRILHLVANSSNALSERELVLISQYYGLVTKAYTLEEIGQQRTPTLTRERVRQIITNALTKITKDLDIYNFTHEKYKAVLLSKKFISFNELTNDDFFSEFKGNAKGLTALLNDCSVKQISYRKNIYFYSDNDDRKFITKEIQLLNKTIRKNNTLDNISKKSKTVTYVPDEIKEKLQKLADKLSSNLNPLYENIIESFIQESPYKEEGYVFTKTKSWRARKGKAQWKQIGIYIDKNVFNKIKNELTSIKEKTNTRVSLMGFICQAFIWKFGKK